jgi:hypothetical protein
MGVDNAKLDRNTTAKIRDLYFPVLCMIFFRRRLTGLFIKELPKRTRRELARAIPSRYRSSLDYRRHTDIRHGTILAFNIR